MGVDDAVLGTWPVWPAIFTPQQGLADDQRGTAVHACACRLVDADELAFFLGGADAASFGGIEEMKENMAEKMKRTLTITVADNGGVIIQSGTIERGRVDLLGAFTNWADALEALAEWAEVTKTPAEITPNEGGGLQVKFDPSRVVPIAAENCPCPDGSIRFECPNHGDPRAAMHYPRPRHLR